jgi:hypothetical protein
MAWLCTKDNQWRNCQMCIVTGPNIDMAIKLIKRMKNIFETKLGLYFQNKETVLELTIEAYPSNHLDSFRSLTNPKFIFLDEADIGVLKRYRLVQLKINTIRETTSRKLE